MFIRFCLLFCLCLSAVSGSQLQAAGCDAAIAEAAAEYEVPYDLFLALALTESGGSPYAHRDDEAWPWVLNQAGESHWFRTREEALVKISELRAAGFTNFDIGCMQLNWKWHHAGFSDEAEMIDPALNAHYAAKFLTDLYLSQGSWGAAVAAYHSATPELAERYMKRFLAFYQATGGQDPGFTDEIEPPRENGFPLLLAGENISPGSLVPMAIGARPLIAGR